MTSQSVPVSKIDFADIPIEDRFPIWKEYASVIFESVLTPKNQTTPFTARITTYHLSSVLLLKTTSCVQYLNRNLKLIAKDGLDHCLIQVYLNGTTSGQWNKYHNSTVRAGDIFLLDLTQPIESLVQDFCCLTLLVPRTMLLKKLPQLEQLHGRVLPRESATAKLLAAHIKALYSAAESLTEEEAHVVAQGVISLTATYFNQSIININCQYVQAATRESIRHYILKNLANPTLNPETIAQHFKISRAYLYQLFNASEGINRYIYEQRLLKAFNCLSNPVNNALLINQIAYNFGFSSESHFSRSFRNFFGVTPSEVRSNTRLKFTQLNSQITSVDQRFEKWVLSLQ